MLYKYISDSLISKQPDSIDTDKGRIYNPTEDTLREHGYLPLVKEERPEGVEGFIHVPKYELKEDHILQTWVTEEMEPEPEPVYTYSKYKIVKALISMGKLEEFLGALDTNGRALWDSAQALRSDDEFFILLSSNIVDALGVDEETFKQVLEQCVAD